MIDQRLTYLHENPVRAEIVREAGDYKYSSALIITRRKRVANSRDDVTTSRTGS
ncbi:MAG: hypothetical protein M3512_11590 [Bacteroidota bacterium]|nr:hypothetical protein [Bacteroidota bacterium]